MTLSEAMCTILETGMRKERDAHAFYAEAAGRTEHPLGKRMFERLADEETKHEQLLAAWAEEGVCPATGEIPPSEPDVLARARAKIRERVQASTADLEAIQLGQEMERKAIAFYQDAAARTDQGDSKNLLLRLKAEEDKHLALLTDLYEYMRDPNLWSVRDERAHFDS
jgi:rubrerythrin